MAKYVLSGKADEDLTETYSYSYQHFGKAKADAYLLGIEERLQLLAESPLLGKKIDHIREGYLRYEYMSHSIFYRLKENGILVVCVLHNRMDTEQHL